MLRKVLGKVLGKLLGKVLGKLLGRIAWEMVEGTKLFKKDSDWWKCSI